MVKEVPWEIYHTLPPLSDCVVMSFPGSGKPKQSDKPLKINRLPYSLRSLAMPKRDYDTVTKREGGGFLEQLQTGG